MPAYNYYTPTFQPYYQIPPQQMMPQNPPQQQMPVVQQQPQVQSGMIWVSGEKEASMYPVAPNNAVALWDSANPYVYLKQADASGKPVMRAYELKEHVDVSTAPESGTSVSYATKEDLETVIGAIKDLDKSVSGVKSDIDTIKGDMYGIAGKKRILKKEDETNG